MKFGPNHYVPVLKVKRGEKRALGLVSTALTDRITPLMEIVEITEGKTVPDHLSTAFRGLADALRPFSRCFLDTREIAGAGPSAALAVFQRASDEGISFTPVTGISRSADVAAAIKHSPQGLALRLTREEFEGGGSGLKVRNFMMSHSLALGETDLIIDLGGVGDLVSEGVIALTAFCLSEVPDMTKWRTLTVSGCAFPKGMGVVGRDSHLLVERAEWLAWRDGLFSLRGGLSRLPTFSDSAMQHPIGIEGFDPRIMQVSATVRYARPEHWLLIKGESTRVTPPGVQFPRLATQLVYGHLKKHFDGPDHCEGCRLIKAAADGADKLGSAEVWRRLGTVHHITMVMDGLGGLPWP